MSGGFSNYLVTKSGFLVRTFIRSFNYVAGSAGWTINKDGSAEFNNVTIRNGEVISGTNLYYSGPPTLGNLVASESATAGTDAEGNAYLAGSVKYSGGVLAVAISGTAIQAWSAPGPAGPWSASGGTLSVFATDFNVFASAGISLGGGPVSATAGTAALPTVITTDTWHSLGSAGSTGCTLEQARYRLTTQNECEIDIALLAGASGSTAGTYTWSVTLPASYQFPGAFLRIYPLPFNAAITTATQDSIIAIDGATGPVPGRVRMTIPAVAANVYFTGTCLIPLT